MTVTTHTKPDTLLRGSLKANATFSMASGVLGTVLAAPIAEFMGLPTTAVLVVAIGVVMFGVLILLNARRETVRIAEARLTVIADIAWVIGAATLIFLFPDLMTTGGKLLLGGISVIVAVFAVLQSIGLRSMEATSRA